MEGREAIAYGQLVRGRMREKWEVEERAKRMKSPGRMGCLSTVSPISFDSVDSLGVFCTHFRHSQYHELCQLRS